MEKQEVCAVILAAGQSTRMETTKQLLRLGNKYVLEHVIDKVVKQTFDQIIVVIGHEANKIQACLPHYANRVQWVVNEHFKLGQSTSFLAAIRSMKPQINSAVFFLGDQPFIKDETITRIVIKGKRSLVMENGPFVIRPHYQHAPGHPLFWGNLMHLDFSKMSGDEGGRSLFPFVKKEAFKTGDPDILFDLDTPNDYQKALQKIEND